MKLAELAVDLVLRGAGQTQGTIDSLSKAMEGARKNAQGMGDGLDAAVDSLVSQRREFTRLQRTASQLGGEETGGTQFAGAVAKAAAAKQAAPIFEALAGKMLLEATQTANLSEKATRAVFVLGDMAQKSGQVAFKVGELSKVTGPFTSMASIGFAMLSGSIGGFVAAGLAGTGQASQLAYQMQRISQTVAGTFLPVIERVTAAIKSVADWMDKLSGKQQDQIMRWTLLAGGILAGVVAVGKMMSLTSSVATGFQMWYTALGKLIMVMSAKEAVQAEGVAADVAEMMSLDAKTVATYQAAMAKQKEAAAYIELLTLATAWAEANAVEAAALGVATIAEEAATVAAGELAVAEGVCTGGLLPLIGALVVGAGALAAFFATTDQGQSVLKSVGEVFQDVGELIGKMLGIVADLAKPFLAIGGAILKIGVAIVSGFLKPIVQAAEIIMNALNPVIEVFGRITNQLSGLFDKIGDRLAAVFGRLAEASMPFLIKFAEAIAGILESLAAGLEALSKFLEMAGLGSGKAAKNNAEGNRSTSRGGSFEDLQATFKRIQQSALKAEGGAASDPHLDVAKQQLAQQKKINENLGKIKPAFG